MVNSDRHEEISDRQTEKVNTMIFMQLDLKQILPFQMRVRFPQSLHIVNTHPIIFKPFFFHPVTNFQTKSPLILSCHFKEFFFYLLTFLYSLLSCRIDFFIAFSLPDSLNSMPFSVRPRSSQRHFVRCPMHTIALKRA